ncbi:MAG: CRISPR-associated protein Csn1 [Ignavibacteriae bacterium]|nr:CRISPR-associated protein Csn1 [Ignavibacteriota bacterium]
MKNILGLDLGTNSLGWGFIENDFEKKNGQILGLGSRIIPMTQDVLGKFDSGVSISQTAERTGYRGTRRLYQRDNLRRERLHRVLYILGFLPKHYADAIDFEKHFGQFKKGTETKLNYRKNEDGKYEFIFKDSFLEMVKEFKKEQPKLFYKNYKGKETKIPYDWTIYYLRNKALTGKITKEELAWLILNFNQKRGYYQLRGEEEETQTEEKKKEFCVLKVQEVIDSGEVIKKSGDKLYDVYFENGWKYEKQITKVENWIGKTKEFIVTTTIKKDGEIKRTYKVVDSEKDWIAIKEKTQQEIDVSKKTVGQYIYESILKNPKQKIRGKLVKTIERKYYKNELEKILKEQIKHHSELNDENIYKTCIDELYPRNEAHQNNIKDEGFEYLFIQDIIFYQRPLKSKKSTIANCAYETRIFYKDDEKFEQPLKGIPKSHPLFQEFRLWQWLKNLKIYQKEKVVDGRVKLDVEVSSELLPDTESIINLFDFLKTKIEIDQNQFLKYFSDKKIIPRQKKDATDYRWNYVEEKKYPCNETGASFLSRLKKVKEINVKEFLIDRTEQELWHIIYSVIDKEQYKKALKTFARKNKIDEDSFVTAFEKYPPFKSAYGSYSEKAIKKLLPLMRIGKYWSEETIPTEVKNRIQRIKERLEIINYDKEIFKTDPNNKLQTIVDDAIPKQLLKSFVEFKDKNHLEGLNTYQACYAVYERHSEASDITKWESPKDIDLFLEDFKQHSLRNPIVEQVVTETLRTVRDIWQFYGNGKKDFFDEIHIELGREMKNTAEKRKKISEKNIENENTNQRIKSLLKELMDDGAKPFSPSHQEILKIFEEGVYQNPDAFNSIDEEDITKIRKNVSPTKADIQKYKLWLEQGYMSPYTGKIIPLGKLFSTEYQIEHIIPQSRYFDNSLSNKVICESAINPNPYKDNQTGYEFINNQGGSIIPELSNNNKTVKLFTLEEYKNHCDRFFKKNRTKLKKLLSEEIPEGFIERQLNDTRYISKLVKGLLSNIVREENEREATSKNIVPVTGAITSKLKQDWGLNEKWNELVQSRFERLNRITNSKDFGYWDYQKDENGKNLGKQFFRTQVPDDIAKGFSKKRIDHRHHALDALVIACCTKDHTNYITSLNTSRNNITLVTKLRKVEKVERKNKSGAVRKFNVAKEYHKPWDGFTVDAKNELEKIVISFKQNNRVINKTNNKTWQWVEDKGVYKKKKVKQTKGKNWAIRKPLHKETVSGKLKWEASKNKIYTATRVSLSEIKTIKHLEKITDSGIQRILTNHLKNYIDENGINFELAFNSDGIDELNKNIIQLNNNKFHQPIYKVRFYEEGKKFSVSDTGAKSKKFVEAAKGTNLFFAIYWNEEKQKREYETIPLDQVIDHQKGRATLPRVEMKQTPMIPINESKGRFLFSLSPNDLVYVPTDEDMEYPHNVDFDNLTKEQVSRIYKMVSSSGSQCFFIKDEVAKSIQNKKEFSSLNKMEKSINDLMIKEICWKLKVDRLGNVVKVSEY